ncbi:MAG: protein-disulfide reductase DsbD domain-containing protein, partial [Verrucomicrobiota bacterium]
MKFKSLALAFCLPLLALAQPYEGQTPVTASLVADTTAMVPGKPFQVGLRLEMAPGWNTYWQYSGDAGLPTRLDWQLPEGFSAGPLDWPLPQRIVEHGDIEVYGYRGKVLLLTTIVPPATLTEKTITLRAKASWLVCKEICIPGSSEVEITLSVAAVADAANAELFTSFRNQIPSTDAPPYSLAWKSTGPSLALAVGGLSGVKSVDFFPLPASGQQVGHPKNSPVTNGTAAIEFETAGDLRGVLAVETDSGRKGWFLSSGKKTPAPNKRESEGEDRKSETSPWTALLYGFLGGLILNLMPCVLPVISLKIFGFIRQAGEDPRKILGHGLAFVAGIFVWFMGLGLLIVALKLAGREVTWAFQFQNPWFNLALASLVFIFALNLFGVFEVVLPGRATNALAEASSGDGFAGSFAQGIFATVLATPCTAPFLGTALGFAFSQSAAVILSMFAVVAFGMGLPYLLLSARPGWMKILPKPGAWMERMKQFMGFPLIATLLWLLDILGNQKGLGAVIWAGGFLLCLAMACWIYGAFCGPLSSVRTRAISLLLILLIVGWGSAYFLGKFTSAQRTAARGSRCGLTRWQRDPLAA